LGEIVTAEQIAREACKIEIETLGKPIGIQDQYIVALGGLRFLEFLPNGEVRANRLNLSTEAKRRLNENLLLFYTGTSRSSSTILKEQSKNIRKRLEVLREIKCLAQLARDQLEAGNVDALGEMLHESWELKKSLASQISNG